MKNIFKIPLLALLMFCTAATTVQAAETPNCQPIFGGGASCEQAADLSINKEIQNPQTKEYADSLGNDVIFTPGQTVQFKITIANTSDIAVKSLTLTDSFPEFVTFSKGQGTFDAKTRTLKLTIDELKARETKVYFIEGKVAAKITSAQAIPCVINQAAITANDKTSRDNTRFCVAKDANALQPTQATTKGGQVIHSPTQTQTTPGTGPESLALLSLFPMGAAGFYLLKKTK